jgi:hypothetical protein
MRNDAQHVSGESGAAGYTFNFQLAHSGTRRACSIRVRAQNFHDATNFFRQNWPMIETMAYEGLISGSQAEIRLDAP